MSLNIRTINNPHTDGRGQAIVFTPHDESAMSVRYDEYDLSPSFFVSMHSEDVDVAEIGEIDDGCFIKLNSIHGEVTLILGCRLYKFLNSLNAATDEWAAS